MTYNNNTSQIIYTHNTNNKTIRQKPYIQYIYIYTLFMKINQNGQNCFCQWTLHMHSSVSVRDYMCKDTQQQSSVSHDITKQKDKIQNNQSGVKLKYPQLIFRSVDKKINVFMFCFSGAQ